MEWYGLPNIFPEDQVKHRLVAPTFELILRPYADKLDLKRTVAGDTILPLCRLKEFACLMRMLSHPPCKISLKKSGKPIYGCTANGEANSDWDEVDRVVSAAWELATRTGISAKVEVSLLELLKARVELKQIALLLSGTSGQVTFQDARHYFPARRTGFLSTFDIVIGAFHTVGVFAVIGDPACREEGFAVESDRIHVLRAFATSATEWDESILDKLVELSANELEAEGVVAILPDRTAESDKAA
jgi:hypothetical protein